LGVEASQNSLAARLVALAQLGDTPACASTHIRLRIRETLHDNLLQ
jgi:hypothetical protein